MPKTTLSKEETTAMLIQACEAIIAAEPMLSEADRNLGDGDHGLGMQRGMTAAKDKLNAAAP
jgi:dihydroxyacetone kinase-like protein